MNNQFLLSEKSVELVIAICETVRRNLPNNQKSVEMAEGISDYVEDRAYLSEKQARWVCQNADYWKLKRPKELADIVLGHKPKQPDAASDNISPKDDIGQILLRLKRIERKLDSLLP